MWHAPTASVTLPSMKTDFHPFLDKDDAAAGAPLERHQVRIEDTWDLTVLFPTPEEWTGRVSRRSSRTIRRSSNTAAGSARARRRCAIAWSSKKRSASGSSGSAITPRCKSSEDSSDAENLAREGQFENLMTRIGEASSFIAPEIQAIDDATFEQYLGSPALAEWQIPLRKLRRLKPHTLSARRGAPARARAQRGPRAQRDLFATDQRRHEVRPARR